jgi:predicted O-methyltransferase YrrM
MAQKIMSSFMLLAGLLVLCGFQVHAAVCTTKAEADQALDLKVKSFLDNHRYSWQDMNVPEADARALFDLIQKNQYKKALEIGTSTGHSGIWMAWALSKTGGKLITIEIDEGRYRQALANFKEAGLSAYTDARLADAHRLVNDLAGPFDFVFIDADKDWYVNYARAVIPKLETGGCLTAHNVHAPGPGGRGFRQGMMGTGEYYDFITSQPGFETSMHPASRSGLSVSYKKKG